MKLRTILLSAAIGVVLSMIGVVTLFVMARDRGWFEPTVPSGPATVRLITAEQYLATIHELFGNDIQVEVSLSPSQRRQGLLSVGASIADMTPGALEEFDRIARTVALQVVDETHRGTLVPCAPAARQQIDSTCAQKFFAEVGRFLFRRPLTKSELKAQVDIAGAVTQKLADFYAGLEYALAGMLISPEFLYFNESTEPDPDHPGSVRLDAYSKATRLSLFLWNAAPDEALLGAAEAGELNNQYGLEQQIDRMLSSARLEQGVRAFFADLLKFDQFSTLAKDPVIYPRFTSNVASSAQEQALRLVTDQLITHRGDYRDLFTTSRTFLDAQLGSLYGAAVPIPSGWNPYQLDATHAAGLLTSLGFLAINSHPGVSSPTRRGRAIREIFLCQKIPDPPPNVSFTIFEDPNHQFKTARDRLHAHATDPVCAGCHKLTDPIGLALENFDGAGAYSAEESGTPIDPSGVLDGERFSNVESFGRAIHDHPGLGPCLVSRLYAYGIGREVTKADRPWLAYMTRRFAVDGYRVPDLLREFASSRAFFAVSNSSQANGILVTADIRPLQPP